MTRIVAMALMAVLVGAAIAQTNDQATVEKRGEALLARLCSDCHAVGRAGTSPHAEAPPFRTLGQRYKIEALEEALAEGLVSGHPDMPEYSFTAEDVGAVIAYLNAIQPR
jgi:cytochrome c